MTRRIRTIVRRKPTGLRGWVCAGCRNDNHCYGGAFCFCRTCGGNS